MSELVFSSLPERLPKAEIRRVIKEQCDLYLSHLDSLLEADKACRGKYHLMHFSGEKIRSLPLPLIV